MLTYSEFQLSHQLHFLMVVIWVCWETRRRRHCFHIQWFQQVVEGIC